MNIKSANDFVSLLNNIGNDKYTIPEDNGWAPEFKFPDLITPGIITQASNNCLMTWTSVNLMTMEEVIKQLDLLRNGIYHYSKYCDKSDQKGEISPQLKDIIRKIDLIRANRLSFLDESKKPIYRTNQECLKNVSDCLEIIEKELSNRKTFDPKIFIDVCAFFKRLSVEQIYETRSKYDPETNTYKMVKYGTVCHPHPMLDISGYVKIPQWWCPGSDPNPEALLYFDTFMKELQKKDQLTVDELADNIAQEELYNTASDRNRNLVSLICCYALRPSINQLFAAALRGDLIMLQQCLEAGINPQTQNSSRLTPFHTALQNGNVSFAKQLLQDKRVIVNGYQPFLEIWTIDTQKYPIALFAKNVETLKFILNLGIDLHLKMPFKVSLKSPIQSVLQRFIKRVVEQKDDSFLEFIELLLKYDPLLINVKQENGRWLIEDAYFKAIRKEKWMKIFSCLVRFYPESLPETILNDIRKRAIYGEMRFIQYLPDHAEIEALIKQEKSSFQDLQLKCIDLQTKLTELLSKHNLNLEEVPLELALEAYILKKKTKEIIKTEGMDPNSPELKSYHNFVAAYDRLVDRHPILREIRATSREIRNKINRSLRYHKFMALWGTSSSKWKSDAALVRERIVSAHKEVRNIPKDKRGLTLLHGTHSGAWPILMKTGKKLQGHGVLMEQGICPLTGEATGAISGWNFNKISVLAPDEYWDQSKYRLPATNSNTRFLIAEGYSSRFSQETSTWGNRSLIFDPTEEYNALNRGMDSLENGAFVRDNCNSEKGVLSFDIKRAVYRLRMTDPDFYDKTKELYQKYETFSEGYPTLNEILKAWKTPPPFMIDQDHPLVKSQIPMLFASSTYELNPNTRECEIVVESLTLEKDVQYLFTNAQSVEKFRKAFNEEGLKEMQAYSFEVGHLLEMIGMIQGVYSEPSINNLKKLAIDFHRDVIPYYVTPLPEHPVYYDESNRESVVAHPLYSQYHSTYKSYIKAVETGSIPPRETHGPMHSARATLFSLMLCGLYTKSGATLEAPRNLIAIATAMHDVGRQDEGVDRWDAKSASIFQSYLRGKVPEKTLEILYDAIKNKDPKDNKFTSIAHRIVYDSDCLEIMRCLGNPQKEFDASKLCFTKLPESQESPHQALIAEVLKFIQVTEQKSVKRFLAENSDNYLEDLVRIFSYVHSEQKCFPVMGELLGSTIAELQEGRTLSEELKQLLDVSISASDDIDVERSSKRPRIV